MTAVELTAYGDEAGTHGDSMYTVMAGWVGRAERWAEFEPKWRSLLLRNGLTYIHAVDLKHGKKQFKDKIRWPEHRRLALTQQAGQLVFDYSMFSHTVLLKNRDYDIHYIGGDRELRKHRAPIDSKYGVCARVFLSQLTEFVRRYGERMRRSPSFLKQERRTKVRLSLSWMICIGSRRTGRGSSAQMSFTR
jgi:hypothetical protein